MFTDADFYAKYQRYSYVYHMTAIKNLDGIFNSQGLCSYNLMHGTSYENIANDDIQQGRASILVPGGRSLHDYVPLYFTYKNPMSASNSHRNTEWVYLVFDLCKIAANIPNLFITDGNGRSHGTQFEPLTSISSLDLLDWSGALRDTKWMTSAVIDRKRKRQAELLVPDRLPLQNLIKIVTVSFDVENNVRQVVKPWNYSAIVSNQGWFFI